MPVDIARCVRAVTDAMSHINFIQGYHAGGRRRATRREALEHVRGYEKALKEIEEYCPDTVKTRSFYRELEMIKRTIPETNLDYHSWDMAEAHMFDVLRRLESELYKLAREYGG